MQESEMILIAENEGFEHPMKKIDETILKAYNKNDVVFLRFIEDEVHVYGYAYSFKPRR
jgi:hypothetical protein